MSGETEQCDANSAAAWLRNLTKELEPHAGPNVADWVGAVGEVLLWSVLERHLVANLVVKVCQVLKDVAPHSLTGQEIFEAIYATEPLSMDFDPVDKKVAHRELMERCIPGAIRLTCRFDKIIAHAAKPAGKGTQREFKPVPAMDWAYLHLALDHCGRDESQPCKWAREPRGCIVHRSLNQGRARAVPVFPSGELMMEGKGVVWENAMYSLAPQPSESTPEKPPPRRSNVQLDEAIIETARECGRPGQDIPWGRFCEKARARLGIEPNEEHIPWGLGDKTISRAWNERLDPLLQDIRDKSDM